MANSSKTGIVIIDPWNFHWCMTACERVSAMVPRWNRALECARKLGMLVIWAPSDVVASYSGYPQRERALATPRIPVPKAGNLWCKFTARQGPCMCGPGIGCIVNFGWDAMNPGLSLANEDYIAGVTEEVYSILKQRGVTHVIYMGLHTNVCLFEKPGALRNMSDAGMKCMLARDINDAITSYDPETAYTPDRGTKQTDEDLERAGIPSINVVDEWTKAGVWNPTWVVETVHITPWGKPLRPYFFDDSVVVTLSTPLLNKRRDPLHSRRQRTYISLSALHRPTEADEDHGTKNCRLSRQSADQPADRRVFCTSSSCPSEAECVSGRAQINARPLWADQSDLR